MNIRCCATNTSKGRKGKQCKKNASVLCKNGHCYCGTHKEWGYGVITPSYLCNFDNIIKTERRNSKIERQKRKKLENKIINIKKARK